MNSRSSSSGHCHGRIPYFEQRFFQHGGHYSPSHNRSLSHNNNNHRNSGGSSGGYDFPPEDAAGDFLFWEQVDPTPKSITSTTKTPFGDNVDISLTAPPLCKWFHGQLDRLTAEKRLLSCGKTGCYLVRESDRKSNIYVLSYLGYNGINHFRITAICGDFFIGGRRFDSLSHLVGFYTTVSDLLKNERLIYPVKPPQPVKDSKRVMAIYPYVQAPDSDELTFLRGDILTVQNDLSQFAEGWMWCTNLRTFESGLVFRDLVIELTEEDFSDPNELLPWYHSNITKEEAVDKLAKMGSGSFLVRKSDRSPGNYSLFFHINNTIQRFRIERHGKRYIMGGRTFDSLDAVVKKYQQEQIVEGHCLGDPVLKPPPQISILRNVKNLNINNQFGHHHHHNVTNPPSTFGSLLPPTSLPPPPPSFLTSETSTQTSPSNTAHSGQTSQYQCPVNPPTPPPKSSKSKETIEVNNGSTAPSTEDDKDVYVTLRESRELAKKKQSVWMKGFLYKKSRKSGKWKYYYFALNSKDQQLCFYENDKRVKPKGVVDLSYSFLYPVHDSLFSRPFCFQLVERTIPCISTYYYLSGETAESTLEWITAIKQVCLSSQKVNKENRVENNGTTSSSNPPDGGSGSTVVSTVQPGPGLSTAADITEVRTLYLTLIDGQRLAVKLLPHPYCLLSLNQVRVARSSVKSPPNPTWEEDFILEDIPDEVTSFSILLLNRRKESKSTEVATVEVDLSSLKSGEEVERTLTLSGLTTPLRDDYGSVRIKLRYVHEVILPLREYSILRELLMSEGGDKSPADRFEVISLLEEFCFRDRTPLAHALLRIFRFYGGKETHLIRVMIDKEIDRHCKEEEGPNTLFRMNSLTTTLMDQYMRSTCDHFLKSALREPLRRVFDTKQSCELNPSKLDSLEVACENAEHLLSLLDTIVESIFQSVDSCPSSVRFICHCLQKSVSMRWPTDPLLKTRVIGSFIFLRLICPAILNPRQFGLIDDSPSETAARSLVMIAKCLQNLANLVEFGIKVSSFDICSVRTFVEFMITINYVETNQLCLSVRPPHFPFPQIFINLSRDELTNTKYLSFSLVCPLSRYVHVQNSTSSSLLSSISSTPTYVNFCPGNVSNTVSSAVSSLEEDFPLPGLFFQMVGPSFLFDDHICSGHLF